MVVDWSATGAMLSGLGTMGGAAAVLVAAVIGRTAFADYRRQKLLERQIEHTDKALVSAYKLNMAISAIRNPMSSGQESAESEADLCARNQLDPADREQKRSLIQANILYLRAKRFSEDFDEAIKALPFVKAYLGSDAFDALSEIIRCRNSVLIYADAYAEDGNRDPDFSLKIRENIWEGFGDAREGDPVKARVSASITKLEAIALPILRLEANKEAKNV